MTDTSDVSDFLMSLELEQLKNIKSKLEQKLKQQQAEMERKQHEQRTRPKLPPTFHDLDALAANTGLDLSGLIKDIKRRS
jgi:NADP-dependent 3-hydroxy acid dehydrogenase YdfG